MMSYRAAIAAGTSSPKLYTRFATCSIGPPALKNSVPMRRAGSVARCLSTAILIVAPRGCR